MLLKQACDKVYQERRAHRKQSQQKVYINQAPGLGVTSQKHDPSAAAQGASEGEEELN